MSPKVFFLGPRTEKQTETHYTETFRVLKVISHYLPGPMHATECIVMYANIKSNISVLNFLFTTAWI